MWTIRTSKKKSAQTPKTLYCPYKICMVGHLKDDYVYWNVHTTKIWFCLNSWTVSTEIQFKRTKNTKICVIVRLKMIKRCGVFSCKSKRFDPIWNRIRLSFFYLLFGRSTLESVLYANQWKFPVQKEMVPKKKEKNYTTKEAGLNEWKLA